MNIQTTILIIHTLIAMSIIIIVLLQRGKGAESEPCKARILHQFQHALVAFDV